MEILAALSAIIWGINWTNVGLMLFWILMLYLFYQLNKGESKFAVDDLFLNDAGKADLYKVILAAMAVLSVYAVVKLIQSDKPIETILLGILGIFVVGRGATQAINTFTTPKDTGGKE